MLLLTLSQRHFSSRWIGISYKDLPNLLRWICRLCCWTVAFGDWHRVSRLDLGNGKRLSRPTHSQVLWKIQHMTTLPISVGLTQWEAIYHFLSTIPQVLFSMYCFPNVFLPLNICVSDYLSLDVPFGDGVCILPETSAILVSSPLPRAVFPVV